jgi:hypothetical protein
MTEVRLTPSCLAMARLLIPSLRSCFICGTSLPAVFGRPWLTEQTLAHLSPLKWEHINLTGDYHWRKDAGLRNRKLRPLRTGVTR